MFNNSHANKIFSDELGLILIVNQCEFLRIILVTLCEFVRTLWVRILGARKQNYVAPDPYINASCERNPNCTAIN